MAGLRIGVTAGRRGGELVAALTRQGARVTWAPTVGVLPAPAGALRTQTAAVLAARPAWVLVTTAEGLRRWAAGAPPDPDRGVPATELLRALCAGELDAVAFTSAPAVDGLFAVAASLGLESEVHDALTGAGGARVLVAAIGPVTAEALEARR